MRASGSEASHVAFGWGSKVFYLETPTWAEFKLSNALWALGTPSPAVLHVEFMGQPSAGPEMRPVRISREQYARLCAFFLATVGPTDDAGRAITPSRRPR